MADGDPPQLYSALVVPGPSSLSTAEGGGCLTACVNEEEKKYQLEVLKSQL